MSDMANVAQEAKFDADELFFSITDQNSTILAGNDVFFRVSGYTKEELIGKYHNVIRHPDMPKIIFKTLWDYIQADKPIIAYVKNRAKNGSFYWVMAAVFPLKDRYISIRFKPGSAIFETVKALYLRLMMAESIGGMEESQKVLEEQLSSLGFDSYSHFMSDAFLVELKKQKEIPPKASFYDDSAVNLDPFLEKLQSVRQQGSALMNEYEVWFRKIDLFLDIKRSFESKGVLLRKLARDIVFLSLNASVSSYKVEHGGEAFGVLAGDIRVNAKENDILISDIDQTVQLLSDTLHDIVFTICCIHVQGSMINFFVEECGSHCAQSGHKEMINNLSDLLLLMIKDTNRLKHVQTKLSESIYTCMKYLDQLEQQMMYLGYIQIYGTIEAGANAQESTGFGVIFSQLKLLISQTTTELESMLKMGKSFGTEIGFLMHKSEQNVRLADTFHAYVVNLGKGEG